MKKILIIFGVLLITFSCKDLNVDDINDYKGCVILKMVPDTCGAKISSITIFYLPPVEYNTIPKSFLRKIPY